MRYSPDYPIVARHLSRVKVRRRSRRPGSRQGSARRSRLSKWPHQQRAAALGLAALIMAAAMLYLMLDPDSAWHPPSPAQITSSLGALFGRTPSH